jgi:hypothetical protein
VFVAIKTTGVDNVEQTNYLGIYPTTEGVYAAVVSDRGSAAGVRCFFVPLAGAESGQPALTAAMKQILQQAGPYEESAVAIRGSLISQYDVHSEFTDYRQIENTIRFDAEEAAATDASVMAVTFEITASTPAGSDVSVYTAGRQTLTDILLDLQAGGLDPSVMEPDAVCLARAIEKMDAADRTGKMFLLVLGRTCFLLTFLNNSFAPKVRIFLLPDEPDKTAGLARQVILTLAGMPAGVVKTLVLANLVQSIDSAQMSQLTGIQVESPDLRQYLNLQIPQDATAEQADGFLFACGSAMAMAARGRQADFRRDFMPYQGRRKLLQKSLRLVSISLTILFLMFGLYFQSRAVRMKNYVSQQHEKLVADYSTAMYGKKLPPGMSFGSKLRNELSRVKQLQQGGLVEGSVVARLTYVLEAINSSPPSVNMTIKSITITGRSISVVGDTNSRKSTRELFDAIKKHNRLEVSEEKFGAANTRDEFVVSLKTKETKETKETKK